MLLILPFLAVLAYLLVGYFLVRLLFGSRKAWSFLPMLILLVIPFIIDSIYKQRMINEFSPICESILAEPIGLDAESTVLIIRTNTPPPLKGIARRGRLRTPGPDGDPLKREFLAVFREEYPYGEFTLLSTNGVTRADFCGLEASDHICGLKAISERPIANVVVTKPGFLNFAASTGARYSFWGSAVGPDNKVIHWSRFTKFRGSMLDGGWTFWWPWPGSHKVLECRTNSSTLLNWLVNMEKE